MADEGNGLHEPWAPPDHTPSTEHESDVPTRAIPIEPPPGVVDEPLESFDVAPPPEVEAPFPPIVAHPPVSLEYPAAPVKRRWPGSAKAVVIILVLLLLGTAAGLGYGWWKTNDDKKDLESASNQQGQELSQQLDKANQALATTQQELTAANGKVTQRQSQLTSAQDEAAAAKKEADTLAALFPINAAKVQPGMPGSYRSGSLSTQTGGCSLATCPSAQLSLSVEASGGGLTVSDPALGRVPLTATKAGWSATGPAAAALQLSCNAAPQATTFTLTLSPAAVALDSQEALQVTTLAGSLLLTSAAVPAVVEPPAAACPAGVASYAIAADRV
jgi:TolA-binding protein